MLIKSPAAVKEKLLEFSNNENILKGRVELVVLYGNQGPIVEQKLRSIAGTLEDLGYGFGIITVKTEDIEKVFLIPEIQYIELPKTLYTSFVDGNKASCITKAWNLYNLSGEGVVVGFIDSGIDYLHPAFRDTEGNTRIEYIYDLSSGDKVWNKDNINKAIKSSNPYEIVSQRDELGHGTHVAGIACAGGNISQRYYGAAYKSDIIMVKMTAQGKVNYAKSTQLMRGIKFILDKSKEIKKPLVINLSFSTNNGAHNGNSLLEQYINIICRLERLSFVIAAGNEGDRGHHVGGVLREKQNITVNIGGGEKSLILQIYKDFINDISIEIKNPTGESTGILKVKEGITQGILNKVSYFIYYTGPRPFDINGEIIISLTTAANFLDSGPWLLILYCEKVQSGKYDIWMPISEGLNKETRFLQPNPFNTLGIPATVENVISVGSYNLSTNTISSFSGRGAENSYNIKPDVVAPGENVESSIPQGGYDLLSGTSMAAPNAAGGCALMEEWGLVKGNDPYMYGERLKYFLLKGAGRERADVNYPDPQWGYGTVCISRGIELASKASNRNNYELEQKRKKCTGEYTSDNYQSYIVEYQGDIVKDIEPVDFAYIYILDENYAIVCVENNRFSELLGKVKNIVYVESQAIYTLGSVSPIDAANISKFHQSPFLTLRGQGVLVGIVDTGIDYLNEEFMYEDDTTRIVSIWDQNSKNGQMIHEFMFGSEFNREKINEAIKTKRSGGNPYEIVDSRDEIGHGTACAGIIGGRGRNPELIGAAPDCEFVVVKLKQAKKSTLLNEGISDIEAPVYNISDILLAIKYLYNVEKKLNKPMVIHLALGTNKGGHDGSSIIERYVDSLAKNRGLVTITGTGNEGDQDIHTTGIIEKKGDSKIIELKVDDLQRELNFQIWVSKPDKVSIGVISPSGEVVEQIPPKLQEVEELKFVFEGTTVFIKYYLPEEITGDQLIEIKLINVKGGIWKFKLVGEYILYGKYDAYLPQRVLLKENTRFLSPTQFETITVPGTGKDIITSAAYNQNDNSVIADSGRGYTRDNRVKPDVAAGGSNVLTTKPGGGTTIISGSSASSSVLAGATALILEWGIVQGNDPTLYSTKIKSYLIRGTDQRSGDRYPNTQWGYGMLDLNKVFVNIRSIEEKTNKDNKKNGIYINIPKEIYDILYFQGKRTF